MHTRVPKYPVIPPPGGGYPGSQTRPDTREGTKARSQALLLLEEKLELETVTLKTDQEPESFDVGCSGLVVVLVVSHGWGLRARGLALPAAFPLLVRRARRGPRPWGIMIHAIPRQ
eukprot:1510805-Rhodomonas_salina.1